MYDVESKQPLQTFDKTQASSGLTMLAWIPGVPGDFLTVSSKTGVLRIWNVSNRSPKDVIKAEAGPFHGISFSDSQRALCRFKSGAVGLLDLKRKSWAMFGRAAHTDTVFAAAYKPADPNMLATCSFDGSVRIWDTRLNRLYRDLVAEDVHVLYALSWSPHDETRLVTTSSHGMVLIWDVENSVLHTRVQLFGDGTRVNPIHAVDWGQNDYIAAGGLEGVVVLTPDGHILKRLYTTPKPEASFGVHWHPNDPSLLASSCQDGIVRLWTLQLEGVQSNPQSYRRVHPSGKPTEQKLVGHTKRCFGVQWSTLLPDLLLSGSDDQTVIVWDTRQNTKRVLHGHTNNVRALHWSYEVPWLCFTGSWDGTIRCWDTRSCTEIAVLTDHHADVYSITSHPNRPAVLLSTSRDTTIRTYSLTELLSPILLPHLLALTSSIDQHHQRSSLSSLSHTLTGDVHAEVASASTLPQACCGVGARTLHQRLEQAIASNATRVELVSILFDFFTPPRGMSNLWFLLARKLGDAAATSGSLLSVRLHELEVPSEDDLLQGAQSQLTALMAEKDRAASRMVGEGVNRRRVKQEDRLRMAAALSCSLGHMEEYCELLIQLEEWTAALAIAPTVSLSYWRSLCARHADHLVEKSAESAIVTPYMIAAGATPHALQYMISRHEFEEAATLATAHSAGMLPLGASGTSIPPSPLASPNGSPAVKATAGGLGLPPSAVAAAAPLMVSEARARRFHEEGEGVLAACCYLSNGEATQSINELLRTHQLELALALALPLNALALQQILLMLAYRAERLHEWSLAVDLLQRTREPQIHIALLGARALRAGSTVLHNNGNALSQAPPDIFAVAALPPAPSYRQLAETAHRGGNLPEAVRCFLVCGDLRQAADIALPLLSQYLSASGSADLVSAQALLESFRQVPLDDGPSSTTEQQPNGGRESDNGLLPLPARFALLGWSVYEATHAAMWRGYTPILMPLLRALQELVHGNGGAPDMAFGPSEADILTLTFTVYAYFVRSGGVSAAAESGGMANDAAALAQQIEDARDGGRLPESLSSAYNAISSSGPPLDPSPSMHARPIVVRGAELASCGGGSGGNKLSFFSGQKISGPSFPLEDGVSFISLSDAVMWAKVHPFSPTHSGCRLNPF